MTSQRACRQYATKGNLALQGTERPRFTVIEGGLSSHAAADGETCQRSWSVASSLSYAIKELSASAQIAFTFACIFLIVGVIASSVLIDAYSASARAQAFSKVDTCLVTVRSGQTLWGIAEDHPVSGCSDRDVVRWIEESNNLSSCTIMPGQQLLVPASQASS